MHTFGRYATLTNPHDLVPFIYLLESCCKNVTSHIITNDDIIVCILCLLNSTFFCCTNHSIVKLLDRKYQ